MTDFTDDVFDEKKVKKAIKKGKRKTIIMIAFISFIVFILFSIVNIAISVYFSHKAFKQWDAYVRLSTPNGYISKTVDSRGFLGGMSHYKISKDMKIKSIVVEQEQYYFGFSPSRLISRGSGGNIGITGEDWQLLYKENGWRELMFFHPNVTYNKYKNDEKIINNIQEDKIYEVAISFDKPYKKSDLPFPILPEMSWLWINTYNDNQLSTFQKEAKENDWTSAYIRENEALGFSVNTPFTSTTDLEYEYHEFLNLLQMSHSHEHRDAYNTMKNIDINDAEILGMVVYGTKEEIVEIMKNPIITASSLGGIIDNY